LSVLSFGEDTATVSLALGRLPHFSLPSWEGRRVRWFGLFCLLLTLLLLPLLLLFLFFESEGRVVMVSGFSVFLA
jgi:hypothetical protein